MRKLIYLILLGGLAWLIHLYVSRDRTFDAAQPVAKRFIELAIRNEDASWDLFASREAQVNARVLQRIVRGRNARSVKVTAVNHRGEVSQITCEVYDDERNRLARAICHTVEIQNRWWIRDMTVREN